MDVLEDHPVFTVVLQALFVLVGFRVGLEVENVAAILLEGEYLRDGGAVPHGRPALLAFAGALDALFKPIGSRREDLFLRQLHRDLLCPEALQGHAVNPPHHLGRFFIHDPAFRIVGVLDVAIGRLAHRLARVALDLVADAPLLADIAGVPLVEEVPIKKENAKERKNGLNTGLHGDMILHNHRYEQAFLPTTTVSQPEN